MKKYIFLLLLIIIPITSSINIPKYIYGVVIDKNTKETIPGSLIITNNGYTYTDFDGKFFIPYDDTIFVRMLSYNVDTVIVKSEKLTIELTSVK